MQTPVFRIFNASTIQSITAEGLIYIVDEEQHFVDFAQCRRNWVDYVNSSPEYATTEMDMTQTRCVVVRDASAEPPTIDFLTTPPTRLTFERAQRGRYWFRRENLAVADLTALQRQIQEAGWTTYDAS